MTSGKTSQFSSGRDGGNNVKQTLVVYATRHGHAGHIAERLASVLQARGLPAEVHGAARIPGGLSLDCYSAAMITASVHRGKHEGEAEEVRRVEQSRGMDVYPTSLAIAWWQGQSSFRGPPCPQFRPGVLSYLELQTFLLHRERKRVIFALLKAPKREYLKGERLCRGSKILTGSDSPKVFWHRPASVL